jgi:hypothetical protein
MDVVVTWMLHWWSFARAFQGKEDGGVVFIVAGASMKKFKTLACGRESCR